MPIQRVCLRAQAVFRGPHADPNVAPASTVPVRRSSTLVYPAVRRLKWRDEVMADPPQTSSAPQPGRCDGGALSPLSGCYLLIVISEPQSEQHKDAILSKITKG